MRADQGSPYGYTPPPAAEQADRGASPPGAAPDAVGEVAAEVAAVVEGSPMEPAQFGPHFDADSPLSPFGY